jgi:hypothetical protein
MPNRLLLGALLSPSIPRAKRRDPGGRWGLTAQRRQAEVYCHVMNADVRPLIWVAEARIRYRTI